MGDLVNLHPIPESDPFQRFWAAFPKQQRLGAARSQWMWALAAANNDHEAIIAGAIRYAEHCRREGTELKYIANPAAWLAEERWHDVYELPRNSPEPSEDARIRALHAQWWGGPDTAFKRDWREKRISEADKAEMRRLGLIK